MGPHRLDPGRASLAESPTLLDRDDYLRPLVERAGNRTSPMLCVCCGRPILATWILVPDPGWRGALVGLLWVPKPGSDVGGGKVADEKSCDTTAQSRPCVLAMDRAVGVEAALPFAEQTVGRESLCSLFSGMRVRHVRGDLGVDSTSGFSRNSRRLRAL